MMLRFFIAVPAPRIFVNVSAGNFVPQQFGGDFFTGDFGKVFFWRNAGVHPKKCVEICSFFFWKTSHRNAGV